MDALIDRVDREARALEHELVALTQALVGCRTDSQSAENPEFAAEAARCQDIVAAWLADLGMEVERWQEQPRYPVVVGRLPGTGGGRSLAFNGHVDVVPAGDPSAWSHEPWAGEVAGGMLWGRGSADMKGGVASCLVALKAIRGAGVPLAGDLWMHVVTDEEVVGVSTRNLVARLPKPDAVVVAEPTDLRLMPVEGGLVHFRIEVEGRESHAGNRYMSVHAGGRGADAGVNAIEKALKLVTGLQELERQWASLRSHPMLPPGFNTLLPGIIAGGPGGGYDGRLRLVSNPGTTPDYCSVEYNLWFLPQERFEDVRDEVEAFVAAVCSTDPWLREHPPRFTWKLRNIYFPPADTPSDHPLLGIMGDALEQAGLPAATEGFTAASELAWYAEQGIPGTIFGPGRIAQAHAPEEHVRVEHLVTAARVLAVTAATWSR
jgi:acetylornithine deacetylase/succinyl-diaminopimelate desuccinylase family protein